MIRALRHAFPAFGAYRIRLESTFTDSDQLIQAFDEDGFTRVIFLDPGGNYHRRSLYEGIKAAGRRFVVFGRGGLPDSWFFDPRGFRAEGASYHPDLWDRPLDADARQRTMEWLTARQDSQPAVNGAEGATDTLADQLGIDGRQVVLVALEEQDTACVPGGPCGGYEGFREWVAHLARTLDPKTHIVLAKRILGETGPEIPNVRLVENDQSMASLIDLASSVVVFESDLGLRALSSGKPVLCCGEAFYTQPGLARVISSKEELVAAVENATVPDEDKRLRFFHYLIEEFYSFGEAAESGDGESRSPAHILFSTIRGLTAVPVELGTLPRSVSLKAPLYFSYGGRDAIQEEVNAIGTLIRMGGAASDRQDQVEAFRLFEAANRRQRNNKNLSRVMVEKAQEAHAAGRYIDASHLFERAHAWVPEDRNAVRSLVETAKAAYAAGDRAEAMHLFDRAQAWFPGDKTTARALVEVIKAAGAAGNYGEAAHFSEIAQDWFPGDKAFFRPIIDVGKAGHAAGNYGAAGRLFEVAYSSLPEDRNLHKLLLETGVQRHGGPLAELAIAPLSELNAQARQAFSEGSYKQATWLFEVLRLRQPDEVEHLRCLAECYLKSGAKRRALECLDEALKRLPGNRRLMRRIRDVKWFHPLFAGKPFLS